MDIVNLMPFLMPIVVILALIISIGILAFLFVDSILSCKRGVKSKSADGKKPVTMKPPLSVAASPQVQTVSETGALVAAAAVEERKAPKHPKAPSKWHFIASRFSGPQAKTEPPQAKTEPPQAKTEPPQAKTEPPQAKGPQVALSGNEGPAKGVKAESPHKPINDEGSSPKLAAEKPDAENFSGEKIKVKPVGSMTEALQVIASKVSKADKKSSPKAEGDSPPSGPEAAQPPQPIRLEANPTKPATQDLSPTEAAPSSLKSDAKVEPGSLAPPSGAAPAGIQTSGQSLTQKAPPKREDVGARSAESPRAVPEAPPATAVAQDAEANSATQFSKELLQLKETLIVLKTTLKKIGSRFDKEDEESLGQET